MTYEEKFNKLIRHIDAERKKQLERRDAAARSTSFTQAGIHDHKAFMLDEILNFSFQELGELLFDDDEE